MDTFFPLSALPTELGLLLLGYAAVDWLLRGGGLETLAFAVHLRSPRQRRGAAWPFAMLLGALSPFWHWSPDPGSDAVRSLTFGLGLLLAWNAATRDIDPVAPGPGRPERSLLLVTALGAYFSPALLLGLAALLSLRFSFWQHHATLPMRLLQCVVAFTLVPTTGVSALVTLLVVVQVSHYLITALAKALLGPRPWSWVLGNRIHFLAASAYSWGFLAFLPWPVWRKVVTTVRKVEVPLQALAFGLELLAPLALLSRELSVGLSMGFAFFHVGVFALSGLLFWDWVVTDVLLAVFVLSLPHPIASAAFGAFPLALGLVVLLVFPLRHKLWKPVPLGWYDSPFTQRVLWSVRGESGTLYGLHCDFMCPHERLYGRVNGCFFAPRRVVTYQLGEVWKPEVRDALVAAGPDLDRLEAIRERFGIDPTSAELRERHVRYLGAFFEALNRGEQKAVLPAALRFLKAPGDQIFYWGELPRYTRQEPVREVVLTYREEYFDGDELVRLIDEEVLRFSVPREAPSRVRPELTPKELDDYLLGLAAGRLIDLPGFKKRYLGADDGRGARPIAHTP